MKKLQLIKALFAIVVIAGAFTFASCGKKTSDGLGKKIEIPCAGSKYAADRSHFRGTGMGESTNLSTAKRKASVDARAALATGINSTIKAVTDRYTQDITVGDANEFAEKFEDMTRSVVNQELNNMAVICEETRQLEGKYVVYMAVEIAKDELLNNVNNSISKDDRLRLDYDKMKFENIFNQEMENLANQRP
ncbi:MAG: LPP20 family lipoprotein [Tenuifilaceae bacterium]|jgi:hypothetical protein|uniref:LPP20 family lipoprotein n=1 Tax=Perlabentimonas gracilis TaxID=2715279 RepID=UPI00140D40BE|nr:LPP20 family lipoprotein [Perlabentimonas gracilis]MDX9770843.1 LPP20 family lipoprotein [Tenuifilaceae bacterium]NHB70031.1 hypothetical protein [Perlabentimonas gracilis]